MLLQSDCFPEPGIVCGDKEMPPSPAGKEARVIAEVRLKADHPRQGDPPVVKQGDLFSRPVAAESDIKI